MFYFLSFSFLLLSLFLLEGSVLLPFGLSPGGFFVSFLVFISGLFFLIGDARWWFLIVGGVMAGAFSAMPFFLFLLFVCVGASFLFLKPFLPIERAFSLLAALWFGAALYLFVFSLLWGAGQLFGFFDAIALRSFISFFASVGLFSLGAFIPISVAWWFLVYRKRNARLYTLR